MNWNPVFVTQQRLDNFKTFFRENYNNKDVLCLKVGTRVSNELVATHSKNTHDDDRLEIDFFFSHKTASAHFYPTHASINLGMKKLKTWLKLWDFMKNWRNRLSWAVGHLDSVKLIFSIFGIIFKFWSGLKQTLVIRHLQWICKFLK